jgi:hypothetical protein
MTFDGVLDWRQDLLTTSTHDSWLQLIIAPSLISTLYKSLKHADYHSQSVTVSTIRLLVTATNSGYSSAFGLKSSLNGGSLPTVHSSVRVRVTLWPGGLSQISSSWRQAPWDSRHSNFTFQLNTYGYGPYVTSSLTRGRVCRLQLLLVLANSVILKSESRGTHDHILLSQIRDSPNLEGQVPVFISPRNRVARLYPQALASLFITSVVVLITPLHGPNRKHRFQ